MAVRTIRQRLGRAIRDRRELLALTQEAAAEGAHLSPRYWRALEAGEPSVGLDIIEKVIAGLQWSWEDLVAVLSPSRDEGTTPASVRRLLDEAWRRATPRERELVTAGLRVLAASRRPRA